MWIPTAALSLSGSGWRRKFRLVPILAAGSGFGVSHREIEKAKSQTHLPGLGPFRPANFAVLRE